MVAQVFIDGEVGTTGLQIRARLESRRDLALISLSEAERKDRGARLDAFARADVAILCLPDAAVHDIAPDLAAMDTRIIDASTAHRVDPAWAYGFAEMSGTQRAAIAGAQFVSNPGCYPTGAISLIRPLVQAGIIAPDHPVTVNAVSGYSGGGKSMIAEFEAGSAAPFFVYGTAQTHKHLPEIQVYTGLTRAPMFVPSVGNFAQGMIVQVPLHLAPGDLARARAALHAAYEGSRFVQVVDRAVMGAQIDPRRSNDTNRLELCVDGDDTTGRAVLIAVLDNLGKGASGAAVQNLNIMLGVDEATGL